ncbi:uncharacterized protein LOC143461994 [Clavelina lepadiformis]|uniref:uncharacterized protein LOC143461994 n=1 Tax=Clavelina lepadiformis TaxID=159417 RepID=UPI00404200F5
MKMSAMILTPGQMLFSMLMAYFLTNKAHALDNGQQCISSECTQNRGYIQYDGPVSGIRWNIRAENHQYTTFVLHLKPTMTEDIQTQWLRIQQNFYTYPKTLFVKNNKERIFVFEETNEVMISLHSFNPLIRFKLDFYAGCKVVEGDVVNIEKKEKILLKQGINSVPVLSLGIQSQPYHSPSYPVNPFGQQQQEPRCWFVVPTITETIQTPLTSDQIILQQWYAQWGLQYNPPTTTTQVKVQQTQMSLETSSLKNGSKMEVVDLISATILLSADSEDILDTATLDKSSNSIQYKENQQISSFIFVDFNCVDYKCDETAFQYTANALRQSDVDCIERERKCHFDLDANADVDCQTSSATNYESLLGLLSNNITAEDLGTSNCPAFNRILIQELQRPQEPTLLEQPKSASDDNSLIASRGHSTRKYFRKCTNYSAYCSADNCSPYKRNSCMKMCMVLKKMMVCQYILKYTIFA